MRNYGKEENKCKSNNKKGKKMVLDLPYIQ
jgi:hypothetical protein